MCPDSPNQILSIYTQRFVNCELSRHSWHFSSCLPQQNNIHPLLQERGHLKERQLEAQLLLKKMEEEKARVHKANPYPYTTDYPVVCFEHFAWAFSVAVISWFILSNKISDQVPPKPEPKPCTRPEGFQLESLVRHELEQQRLMEERERLEREEAQKRIVKAQPILKEWVAHGSYPASFYCERDT